MTVIGLGNTFRHDDAAGLIAARRLCDGGVAAEEFENDPAMLIERWSGGDTLIVIDAISSGVAAGTLHRLDASRAPLPWKPDGGSTHAFGLAQAIELSRALGTLPPRLVVFGIEGRDFTPGTGLSPEVERAIPVLVNAVRNYLSRACC